VGESGKFQIDILPINKVYKEEYLPSTPCCTPNPYAWGLIIGYVIIGYGYNPKPLRMDVLRL